MLDGKLRHAEEIGLRLRMKRVLLLLLVRMVRANAASIEDHAYSDDNHPLSSLRLAYDDGAMEATTL